MKNFINIIIVTLLLFTFPTIYVFSQSSDKSTLKELCKARLNEIYKTNSISEINKLHPHQKLDPNNSKLLKTNYENYLNSRNLPPKQSNIAPPKSPTIQAAGKIRTPGEFEESQAVVIAWPFYCFDENGTEIFSYDNGMGYDVYYNLKKIAIAIPDLDELSPYTKLWTDLAFAIQQECTVMIRIPNPEDSIDIKNWMFKHGKPLTNYKFFTQEFYGNDFWMRDYGPWGFYYGDQDSVGLLDLGYYPGRPLDDDVYKAISASMGLNSFISPVETEGGNYMTDGYTNSFSSDVFFAYNSDSQGHADTPKMPMDSNEVMNSLTTDLNAAKFNILPSLKCDGGTGHIDLYLKMIDDQTILTTDYPIVFDNNQFPDYQIAQNNIKTIKSLQTSYGTQFETLTLPLPTDNEGNYDPRCTSLYHDARTYINGLTVNKTYIMPIYSDTMGNVEQDKQAVERIKTLMPGYKIVPIDSRLLSVNGGEIHCITIQIPADNPILIQHKKEKGIVPTKFNVVAKITNHSGINYAKLHWRQGGIKDNPFKWYEALMTLDNNGNYSAVIDFEELLSSSEISNPIVDYYIEAVSNNGKESVNPITAPDGFYTVKTVINSVEKIDENSKLTYNTDKSFETFSFRLDNLNYSITQNEFYLYDVVGNLVAQSKFDANMNNELSINSLSTGTYIMKINSNGISKMIKFNVFR